MTLGKLCTAVKRDGSSCKAKPLDDTGLCLGHHPQSQDWRSKGGRNSSDKERSRNLMPEELRPLASQLLDSMNDLLEGQITPSQGQALASLTNSLVKVIEAGVWEIRLRRLEERIVNVPSKTNKHD